MEKELIKAFSKIREEKSDLASNIWHKIVMRDRRIVRLKLYTFLLIGLTSLIGLIPAWQILSGDLARSGLYEYFSLIFSNGNSIVSYWKELTFSIAESLPTMSIALSLSLIFILFFSLKYAAKQIGNKGQLSLSF
jgi:hypothetical protein